MARRKVEQVSVLVTREGHTHAGLPVPPGTRINASPSVARFLEAAKVGVLDRKPPPRRSRASGVAHAKRRGSKQGGAGASAGSDNGDDPDGDPAADDR